MTTLDTLMIFLAATIIKIILMFNCKKKELAKLFAFLAAVSFAFAVVCYLRLEW
jgi:hypothetical protein